MVDKKLQDYVNAQLKRGYSKEQVKQTLLRYGYSEPVVLELFSKKPHKALIFVTVLAIVCVFLVMYYFLASGGGPGVDPSLSFDVSVTGSGVVEGEPLSFTITFDETLPVSEGSVTYAVKDNEGNTLASRQENLVFSQTLRDTISLPHTVLPGVHTLVAMVRVGQSKSTSSAQFTIKPKPQSTLLTSSFSSPSVSDKQQIADIVGVSVANPTLARKLCKQFANKDLSDDCLLESGLESYSEVLCEGISNAAKRDTCYFNIVLVQKNPRLCSSINDVNLRSTCEVM